MKEDAFIERYRKWCKCKGYHFSQAKAIDVYDASFNNCPTLSKCEAEKMLITSSAKSLIAALEQRAIIKAQVIHMAEMLPEYECVQSMYGVGEITGAQLIAELGDIRNFANRRSIVAFAGVDPEVNESG